MLFPVSLFLPAWPSLLLLISPLCLCSSSSQPSISPDLVPSKAAADQQWQTMQMLRLIGKLLHTRWPPHERLFIHCAFPALLSTSFFHFVCPSLNSSIEAPFIGTEQGSNIERDVNGQSAVTRNGPMAHCPTGIVWRFVEKSNHMDPIGPKVSWHTR